MPWDWFTSDCMLEAYMLLAMVIPIKKHSSGSGGILTTCQLTFSVFNRANLLMGNKDPHDVQSYQQTSDDKQDQNFSPSLRHHIYYHSTFENGVKRRTRRSNGNYLLIVMHLRRVQCKKLNWQLSSSKMNLKLYYRRLLVFLPISVPCLSTASNPIEALKTVYYWASWTLELLYNWII